MNQLNSLILEGNVCKEPEIKEINGERNLATFSIAVNRYYKKSDGDFEQEVSYFDIEVWGSNYVKMVSEKAEKGSGVRVVGRLKQNRWQDQSGKWQSRVSVVAEHIEFRGKVEKKEEQKPAEEKSASNKTSKMPVFQSQESEEPMPKATNGFDIF